MLNENEVFKLDDEVLHRFVQIFQEALLLGIDVSDIMRQVRLVRVENALFLDPQYKNEVKDQHETLLKDAEKIKEELMNTICNVDNKLD